MPVCPQDSLEFFLSPSASLPAGSLFVPRVWLQSNTAEGQIKQIPFQGEMSRPYVAKKKSHPALRISAVTLFTSQFPLQGSQTLVVKQRGDQVCWLLHTFSCVPLPHFKPLSGLVEHAERSCCSAARQRTVSLVNPAFFLLLLIHNHHYSCPTDNNALPANWFTFSMCSFFHSNFGYFHYWSVVFLILITVISRKWFRSDPEPELAGRAGSRRVPPSRPNTLSVM